MNDLLQAISDGNVQKLKSLIAHGNDINAVESQTMHSPVSYIMSTINSLNFYWHHTMLDVLALAGADVNVVTPKMKIPPLLFSIETAHRKKKISQNDLLTLVKTLLAHGADVNGTAAKTMYARRTPLYTAVEAGYYKVVAELLNVNAQFFPKVHPLARLLLPGKHLNYKYMAGITREVRYDIASVVLQHGQQRDVKPVTPGNSYVQTIRTFLGGYPQLPAEVLEAAQDIFDKEAIIYHFYQHILQKNVDQVRVLMQDPLFYAGLQDPARVQIALTRTKITFETPDQSSQQYPAWFTLAATYSDLAVVEALYQQHSKFGWTIHECNKKQETPLTVAIEANKPEIAQFFLEHGASLSEDHDGILAIIVDKNRLAMLKMLLEHGVTLPTGKVGSALLQNALVRGHAALFSFLWEHGLRFNDEKAATLLASAIRGNRVGIVRALLTGGVRLRSFENLPRNPTPGMLALLQEFDIEYLQPEDVIDAVIWGNEIWVRQKFEKSSTSLLHLQHKNKSLLYWALKYQHQAIARFLVEHGAWSIENNREICLYLAVSQNYVDIVRFFLTLADAPVVNAYIISNDMDLNTYYYGDSLLHCAARSGFEDMVRLLLEAGANAHLVNGDVTPLMEAQQADQQAIVQILLEHQAGSK